MWKRLIIIRNNVHPQSNLLQLTLPQHTGCHTDIGLISQVMELKYSISTNQLFSTNSTDWNADPNEMSKLVCDAVNDLTYEHWLYLKTILQIQRLSHELHPCVHWVSYQRRLYFIDTVRVHLQKCSFLFSTGKIKYFPRIKPKIFIVNRNQLIFRFTSREKTL